MSELFGVEQLLIRIHYLCNHCVMKRHCNYCKPVFDLKTVFWLDANSQNSELQVWEKIVILYSVNYKLMYRARKSVVIRMLLAPGWTP